MTSTNPSALVFFAAVMLLSIPFWLVGEAGEWQLLPGVPVSALMFPVPGIVAFALLSLRSGRNAALKWLLQLLGFRAPRRARWLVMAIGVPPAIFRRSVNATLGVTTLDRCPWSHLRRKQ